VLAIAKVIRDSMVVVEALTAQEYSKMQKIPINARVIAVVVVVSALVELA
jgi:hypothetical protein